MQDNKTIFFSSVLNFLHSVTDCKVKIGQLHKDQLWKISGYLVIALNASGNWYKSL